MKTRKDLLRTSAPRLYRWLSRERNVHRLAGLLRDGDVDFGLLADTIKKSRGTYQIECPLCGFIGLFKAFGSPPRWNAQCPACGALERHRQLALVLRDEPVSGDVLHFAPEAAIAALLKARASRYVSADLCSPGVDLQLNIEKIDMADGQWDAVVCCHVLEHVDDKKALSELHRILKPGGVLIAMVPIVDGCERTYEDENVTSPDDREIHFRQEDHVRLYGADFVSRLIEAGFDTQVHTAFGKEAIRYGLLMGDKVFVCRKSHA